jgi:hypothetical protein
LNFLCSPALEKLLAAQGLTVDDTAAPPRLGPG